MTNKDLDELLIWATNYNCKLHKVQIDSITTVTNVDLFIESHIFIIEANRHNVKSLVLKNCVLRLKKFENICKKIE